jgi:hypothetical protein
MKILTWLTTERLLICILFIAIFVMAVRLPADSDTWWHLRSGQLMVEQGRILRTDPFSHTRGGWPWIDHGWLAEIAFYLLYRVGGFAGVALGVAAIVTLAFALVFWQSPGSPYLRAFTTVLAAITSSVIWAARPQLLSFLLAALVSFFLDRYRSYRQRKFLYPLPVIVLLWVNIHGGFATAFILLLCYLVGEGATWLMAGPDARPGSATRAREPRPSPRHLAYIAAVTGVCVLVVPLNPNTTQMLTYPFHTVGIGVLRQYIQEWASPDFHQLFVQPFIWLLLLTLLAIGRAGQRAGFTDLTLLAVFAYMSLLAGRNIALFALVAGPILARYGQPAFDGLLDDMRERPWAEPIIEALTRPLPPGRLLVALNWLLLLLVLAGGMVKAALPLSPQAMADAEEKDYPAKAVRFIQEARPPGPLLNSYNWGGYIIWTLWPDYSVYVDGRTDLYGETFISEYIKAVTGQEGWQELLDRQGINLVLIERQSPLSALLSASPAWQRAYADEIAAVFIRRKGR